MYSRILVPLDGSPLAEAALPHAVALAWRFDTSLILLQVLSSGSVAAVADPIAGSSPDASLTMEVMEAERRTAQDYLEKTSRRIALDGVRVEWEVAQGSPAQEIARTAQQRQVDLIVMSTHGRSGLGRLVFGSVADRLLRECTLPVLLIRPKGN